MYITSVHVASIPGSAIQCFQGERKEIDFSFFKTLYPRPVFMICYFTCFLFPFLSLAISPFLSAFYWLCFSVPPHYWQDDDGGRTLAVGGLCREPASQKRKGKHFYPDPSRMIDCCDRMSRALRECWSRKKGPAAAWCISGCSEGSWPSEAHE